MLPLALLLLAPPAEPLPVPADALAVAQVRGLDHLRQRLADLAVAVAPEKAAEFREQLADLFKPDGRDPFALGVTGRAFVAVLPTESGVTWAAHLPTRDYARFRETVLTPDERRAFRPGPTGCDATEFGGKPLFLIDRTAAGFVAVTPHEPSAKRLAADPKPLAVEAVGDTAGVFLGSDVGLWVNLPAVAARYGGVLAGTRLMLPRLLATGAFGLPKLDKRQADQVATVANGVLQAAADGSGFAVGLGVGPAGVTVRAAMTFRPGTRSAKVLAGERPRGLDLLAELPGGQTAYAAGRFGTDLDRLFAVAFPEFETATAGKPMAALWAGAAWAAAGDHPGPVLEVRQTSAARTQAFLERFAARTLGPAGFHRNVPLAGRPAVTTAAVEHRGLTFDHVALAYDLGAATAAIADEGVRQAAHATVEKLVGDWHQYWLAAGSDRGLKVSAADWPAARKLVEAYRGDGPKVADDPAVQAIRRRLPAEASAVVLLDAAAFTCKVGDIARGAVDALPAFPGLELPEFVRPAGRSAFFGLALVTKPGAVHAELVLPTDALKASLAAVKIDPVP